MELCRHIFLDGRFCRAAALKDSEEGAEIPPPGYAPTPISAEFESFRISG